MTIPVTTPNDKKGPHMNIRFWFDTLQAANHTGTHPQTIRKAAEAGELHGSQRATRGRWRFHRDCLDAWMLGEQCPHEAAEAAGLKVADHAG